MSETRYRLASASIGEIVAFGGGWNGSLSSSSSVVDVYNITSNSWFTLNLSQAVLHLHQHPLKTKYSLEVLNPFEKN
jgi:hypothetical protein